MGMSVCFGVNIPFEVILQLPIPVILRRYRTKDEPWGGLILDVAEQEILDNIPVVCGLANQLAQCNVRFAIDNFGECIANGGKETIGRVVADLAKLKNVSFAEMKLFPGLVNDCATDPQRSQICRAVISLTHRMNSIAVAVGVEKTADLKTLEDMGCDVGQGILFGEPMSNQQFTNLMRSRGAKSA